MIPILILYAQSPKLPETFEFTWRPKARQVTRYRLSLHVDLSGNRLTLTADIIQKVGDRGPKGEFSVTSTTRNVRVVTDADTQTVPDEPPAVEKYDARGRRLAAGDDAGDWFGENLGHCTDFVPPPGPVKVGQRWSATVNPGGGLLGGRLDYRLADVALRNKLPFLHVRYAFAEKATRLPVKAEGYFYIDPRDFSVEESEAVVRNARISPDLPQSPSVEVHMARVRP